MDYSEPYSPDRPGTAWRRSSWSGVEGGNCVEVAFQPLGTVSVRDSKSLATTLVVSAGGWSYFVAWLKEGID